MKLTDSVEPPALSQEVFSWKQTERTELVTAQTLTRSCVRAAV